MTKPSHTLGVAAAAVAVCLAPCLAAEDAAVDAGGRFDVVTAPGRGIPEGRYQVGPIPSSK